MLFRSLKTAALTAGLLLVGGAAANAQTIIGAGASFPAPLYQRWAQEFKNATRIQVNYQSIGSGGGIKNITARAVDFGATDAPMTADELAKAPGIRHIPTVAGAVAIAYNVPGVPDNIKLTGPVIADIYLGKIRTWNDPAITSLNPGVRFPASRVVPVFRADSSGTTNIVTTYLSQVSPAYKGRVGAGKSVRWPGGVGGKGNEGVTAVLRQTPGSIGYVELAYAKTNRLTYASVRNAKGQFIRPTLQSASIAAGGAKLPADFRAVITNTPASNGYPITGFTFVLIYPNAKPQVKQFLQWALTSGQRSATALEYAPLPASVQKRAIAALR
jgi:phosphate transport system substrate-binding protein